MTCQEFLARYSDYLDERMDAMEAPRWRRHVDTCRRCARYDRILRQGLPLMRGLPPIEPSYDFFPRLQHRLYHVEDDLRTGRRPSGAGVAVSLAVAGTLAILAWGPLLGPERGGGFAAAEARAIDPQATDPPEIQPGGAIADDAAGAVHAALNVRERHANRSDRERLPTGATYAALDSVVVPLFSVSSRIWRCRLAEGGRTTSCWGRTDMDVPAGVFTADVAMTGGRFVASPDLDWPVAAWLGLDGPAAPWPDLDSPALVWTDAAWPATAWPDTGWAAVERGADWPPAEWRALPASSFDGMAAPVHSMLVGVPGPYSPLFVSPPASQRLQAMMRDRWISTVSAPR